MKTRKLKSENGRVKREETPKAEGRRMKAEAKTRKVAGTRRVPSLTRAEIATTLGDEPKSEVRRMKAEVKPRTLEEFLNQRPASLKRRPRSWCGPALTPTEIAKVLGDPAPIDEPNGDWPSDMPIENRKSKIENPPRLSGKALHKAVQEINLTFKKEERRGKSEERTSIHQSIAELQTDLYLLQIRVANLAANRKSKIENRKSSSSVSSVTSCSNSSLQEPTEITEKTNRKSAACFHPHSSDVSPESADQMRADDDGMAVMP